MKILQYVIVLLCIVSLAGCGKGNPSAPVTIDPSTGKHQAGMAVASTGGVHVDAYFSSPASCVECHGTPGDLSGGIAKVSCSSNNRSGMTCHAGKFPHGIGFGNPLVHGEKARNAVIGTNGIAFCKKCHGSNYKGIAGSGVSCIACHKLSTPASNAPHAGDWLGGTFRHSATDESNAPACGECHLAGQKLATPVPLPAGAPTPTCFGSTALCHFEAGHANPYIAKTDHGLAARSNLMQCAPCHATFPSGSTVPNFARVRGTTNLSPNGCQNCHTQAGLAHPYGWLPGRGTTAGQAGNNTTSHTTASFGTAGEYCSPCHALTGTTSLPNSAAPSCMTQAAQIGGTTYCHFTAGPVANRTGCLSCHGNPPNGASVPNTANAHPKHAFACDYCHNGAGTVTQLHANGTPNISFLTAQTGAATFIPVAKTCTNVSCHRGITTPAWTATNVGCSACHNPPSTSGHPAHLAANPNLACTTCHLSEGPGLGVAHPNSIVNTGIPTTPADFSEGGPASYDPVTRTCSNVSCHGQFSFSSQPWTDTTKVVDVADQSQSCTINCHQVTNAVYDPAALVHVPYIGPFSGRVPDDVNTKGNNLHFFHVARAGLDCTTCHTIATHFNGLTQGRRLLGRGFAAGTVGVVVAGDPVGGNGVPMSVTAYDPVTSNCTTTTVGDCHIQPFNTPDTIDPTKLLYRWYK